MPKSNLIVFEGPDGVGKSTLLKATGDLVQQRVLPYVSLSFPGKTPGTLGNVVDTIHHNPKQFQLDGMTPLALQALHIAAHLDAIERVIKPALQAGKLVLLDRLWWSTWVYGQLSNVNESVLSKLIEAEKVLWADITPGIVFLIQHPSAFNPQHNQQTFETLVSLYDQLAEAEEHNVRVVRISNDELSTARKLIWESIASTLNLDLSA